jgi:dTDP-4-dehydrorhamnose 3,5-epimerase-like enzyme
MINRVCSYCRSNTGYYNYKESKGYWYSLVTRDNKTCLYFLCNNCYAKQTDKNPEWNPIIINTKSQNRKELEHKTKNFCHNP